ncbi:MAG: carbamoyltransferase HypF [Paracoccaceae bacterium]|nr:carbamoyltransferase HypF [Paracoccaceae bacterium]
MQRTARIRVRGQVQGVGFRPFVWTLASEMGLQGEVLNDPEGVLIFVQGGGLEAFAQRLRADAPPLARVDAVEIAPHHFDTPPQGFVIAASIGRGAQTQATPDAATCPDCLAEIRGTGRRRGYAFTNCTHCGPRFSILHGLPYDRGQTSMAAFEMCAACRAEYENPADRRFHAQPVACPDCGPRLWYEVDGTEVAGDAIALAARALRAGKILAIKGLGGFHLACDATNTQAIATLRARKRRPAKPFALMGTTRQIAEHSPLAPAALAALRGPAAPVVLLENAAQTLPEGLAPGINSLGWMLPYTPLHHLLLDAFGGVLVMTSGNLSGEPQVIGNDEARQKLVGFADGFLLHDRDILRRLDDSVLRAEPAMVLRRGRGMVPATLSLPPGFEAAPAVTAYGGQMKAAICMIRSGQALVTHHLGDLDDALTWEEFLRAETDYTALFDHQPALVACDLHDGFRASRHARAQGLPVVAVQHHHAHLAACLGDNLWPIDGGKVAGIILDGLGLGTDGTIWGGEVLLGDYTGFERVAHLAPAPLAGGDRANTEPWRNAVVRLDQAGLGAVADRLFADHPVALLRQIAAAGVNAPLSSSVGRLFDAVAAVLGLCAVQSYEGEAGARLEAQVRATAPPFAFGLTDGLIDPAPMFRALIDAMPQQPPAELAARFHAGLAQAFCAVARAQVASGRAKAVVLSGGCFQNAVLLRACLTELSDLPVLIHKSTPANDGGLAFGQALIAAAQSLRQAR